jgi:hypothetical protein
MGYVSQIMGIASMLKYQFDQFVVDGFDELGAFVMVIDGFPPEERYQPTVDLLEEIGYQRVDTSDVGDGEYNIKTAGGHGTEASMKSFFCSFKMGKHLIQYQPVNRCILRGTSCKPHRPESDFRFADWYPVKGSSLRERAKKIEDQLADDFPNAAMAAQFLYDLGFARSNTYKKLPKNTYFVASRHGDGQPSGIVFRGVSKTYFYDYYEDERYEMGSSGLLKDFCPTKRQLSDSMSLAVSQFPSLGSFDE